MHKFIKDIIIFIGVIALILIVFHLFLINNREEIMKIDDSINKIYLGNSTVEQAINDSLLENGFNFARSAESIDLIYAKIQLLKEANPNIDTIYVCFDDIILYKTNIYYDLSSIFFLDKFSTTDYLMNLREFSFGRNTESISHLYDISKIKPMILSYISKVDIRDLNIGGYLWSTRSKLYEDLHRRKKENVKALKFEDFPRINKYYLNEIISYCKNNGITLFFFITPRYPTEYPDTIYRNIHQAYFKEIPLLDYSRIQLPDSCFGDCVHLNYKGAKIFTEILNKGYQFNDQ